MLKRLFFCMFLFLPLRATAEQDMLLKSMEEELNRSFKLLKHAEELPLYFLQYEVWDRYEVEISTSYGAVNQDEVKRRRYLTVDARVGSYKLDNTHEIRGGGFDFSMRMSREIELPLEDDADAIKSIIWKETDLAFKDAQEQFIKVKATQGVKVAESDTSPDFSTATLQTYTGDKVKLEYDRVPWREKLKKLSSKFKKYPWIHDCSVELTADATNRYLVNNEGTKIRQGSSLCRVIVYGKTVADDGMELWLHKRFDAHSIDKLPDEPQMALAIDSLINNLMALRSAPLTEPYTGPAILINTASGVFFHEIFGHRMEGHRQKSEEFAQTFTYKVGKIILPEFLSVYDDPTLKEFNGTELRGYYKYDDEGVPSERVSLVEDGVLKGFIMSRSPIKGFPKSNGHGRREHGNEVVARQGNLIVESKKQLPYKELYNLLIDECKKQGKPYGLILYDISGGFAMMGRYSPQTFKVIPLLVSRVYPDGREEVVRGVDICGTPLTCFGKIMATGDDTKPFNGTCGAESGWVPVSGISPSILIKEIEIEKKEKAQDKPPLLPAPLHE